MTGSQKSNHSPSGPKHVVVLSHPDPDSFNMAVAQAYCETVRGLGHQAATPPKHQARMPFWACRRFSASSKTADCGPSMT